MDELREKIFDACQTRFCVMTEDPFMAVKAFFRNLFFLNIRILERADIYLIYVKVQFDPKKLRKDENLKGYQNWTNA